MRRPCVCTPFPYCDFATFHFLFGNRRNRRFSNKKCVASLRPTSYLKSGDFGRKYAILRLASYLKIADFGRKCAISQPLLDMRPALRAGLSGGSSLGQRPATLFIRLLSVGVPRSVEENVPQKNHFRLLSDNKRGGLYAKTQQSLKIHGYTVD